MFIILKLFYLVFVFLLIMTSCTDNPFHKGKEKNENNFLSLSDGYHVLSDFESNTYDSESESDYYDSEESDSETDSDCESAETDSLYNSDVEELIREMDSEKIYEDIFGIKII